MRFKIRHIAAGVLFCSIACLPLARSAEPAPKSVTSTVTIDAYWLRLTSAQLPAGQGTVPATLLTDPKVVYARARVVGYEGQEVTVDSTRTVDVVTGATPVVAPGVSVYQLSTSAEKFGVNLTETPSKIDGDSIELSFASTVTMEPNRVPEGMATTQPTTDPANQSNPMVIDAARQVAGTSSVVLTSKSTLRVTAGVPTIVCGMSDHPGANDDRTLCLVLCATVAPAK